MISRVALFSPNTEFLAQEHLEFLSEGAEVAVTGKGDMRVVWPDVAITIRAVTADQLGQRVNGLELRAREQASEAHALHVLAMRAAWDVHCEPALDRERHDQVVDFLINVAGAMEGWVFKHNGISHITADFEGDPDGGTIQPLTPVAPSAGNFMWQGQQLKFTRGSTSCTGRAVAAMGDQAFCYLAADDTLKCAGQVYTRTFGTSFVAAGQSRVDQVFLSPTFNSATGNAMCVHRTDGTAWCMGDANSHGQFGNGATGAQASFVQWGTFTDLRSIATGTWDQICALNASGQAFCSGYSFGTSPMGVGNATASLWVDTFGAAHIDDASVLRAATGRTECTVRSTGLVCSGTTYGTAGAVVDGTRVSVTSGQGTCWLDTTGTVHCRFEPTSGSPTTVQRFASGQVVLLAANLYTDSLCAIYNDASVWCIGSNSQGKLGTADTATLATETMVQPAGSALLTCL